MMFYIKNNNKTDHAIGVVKTINLFKRLPIQESRHWKIFNEIIKYLSNAYQGYVVFIYF